MRMYLGAHTRIKKIKRKISLLYQLIPIYFFSLYIFLLIECVPNIYGKYFSGVNINIVKTDWT
jgi:hypothetical protein